MQLSLFDLHCDTACEMLAQHQNLRENHLAVSLNKASGFRQYIQVMALWTDHRLNNENGWRRFGEMHRNLYADPSIAQQEVTICTSCPPRADKTFLLLGLEDARILNGKPERVDEIYRSGVRILTPLWSGETCIGGSHDTNSGLTDFGKNALQHAVSLGMIADISHASVASADEIFSIADTLHRPVIASHSNAYAVCPVSRNLHDKQIDQILRSGGVIGLNLYTHFLTPDGNATMEHIRRHIAYFLEHGAEKQLCFGCDMDGAALPAGLSNLAALPQLAEYLLGYYPESLVHALFFENAYRFAKQYLFTPIL